MMQPQPISPAQAALLLGGMRDVLGDDPGVRGQRALQLAAMLLDAPIPAPTTPDRFRELRDAPCAELAVVALIVAACLRVGSGLDTPTTKKVARYAAAAGAGTPWARALSHAAHRRTRLTMATLGPHAPDGRCILAIAWREHGVWGILQALGTSVGWMPAEPARALWWRRLGLLPAGTVGRTLWAQLTTQGIPLPGEVGGLPESAIHHDIMHVLTGIDTSPHGECQIGGFYAGFLYPGWPAWVLAALFTFELGLAVSPAFVTPATGQFDPDAVLAAARRARRATFHPLDDDWDYRALMAAPLDAARAQLGLSPEIAA